ncbi:UvrD-helicase domain-containing protein [Klebsiella pneumoniae]
MTRVSRDDWVPQGVGGLEGRAWEALRETDSSILVTAGAGAGKTEFLAQKASYLLQTGICPAPKRILAISFKKDAAQNLAGNDSNLLIVFYVQIMPDDFVMQLHRF